MKYLECTFSESSDLTNKFGIDEISLRNYFLNPQEKRYKILAYYDENIRAIAGTIDSITIPCWILSRSHTAGSMENVLHLIKKIIDSKEGSSILQFFTLFNDEEYFFYKKHFDRYQSYLEHSVEVDSLTGYENIDHDIMEYKTYSIPLKIHLWVLKNEYRSIKK